MLLFQKKVSLFIPRSSFFFVIHVSVDIKTQWEKDIVVVFSLYKSGWPRDFPPKTANSIWVAIPVDSVIFHWTACGVDGRAGGRANVRSRDYQNLSDA